MNNLSKSLEAVESAEKEVIDFLFCHLASIDGSVPVQDKARLRNGLEKVLFLLKTEEHMILEYERYKLKGFRPCNTASFRSAISIFMDKAKKDMGAL